MMHAQPGLDGRHRDADGEISRKHGNTSIDSLRDTYGACFAPGFPGYTRLRDVLDRLDEPSLSRLIRALRTAG
jgi:hypothetical protein